MEARVEACFRTARKQLANDNRETDGKEKAAEESKTSALSPGQMKQLRALYLRLAKCYHPDKVRSDEKRGKQKQMMTLINRAYEERDVQTLERMSVEDEPPVESTNETIQERKRRFTKEMNRLMHTID
jgi:hypothetical protein